MWDAPSIQRFETPRELRDIIGSDELADLIDATLDMGGSYSSSARGEFDLLTLVQPGHLPIRLLFSRAEGQGMLVA